METTRSLNIEIVLVGLLTLMVVVVGLYASFSNVFRAQGPKERRFLLRVSFGFWSTLILLVGLMWYLPSPWRFVVLIPYFIIIPVGIYEASVKSQLIREIDERDRGETEDQAGDRPREQEQAG